MRELHKRRRSGRFIYSLPFLVLLFIITFILAKGAIGVLGKGRESVEMTRNLKEKAASLAMREMELKEDIARLETEEGLREEIRDKFSVTEEGEFVAVIVDERRATSSDGVGDLPWYKRLWTAIIGGK